MSAYKCIAVAGAGNIGQLIIEELINLKKEGVIDEVVQLSRSAGGHTQTKEWGVKLEVVDYNDHATLVNALQGVDVVISAVGGAALALQEDFAQAAKEAGVKLFVPSEFGNPTQDRKEGALALKDAVRRKLKDIDLPYAVFYTGPFSDFLFTPHFGFNFRDHEVTIGGEGNSKISFTTRKDVARFVAHVLTTLPKERLEWKIFRIEGDRKSFKDVVNEWDSFTGKPTTINYISREALQERLDKNPKDVAAFLLLDWDNGNGVSAKDQEDLDNKLWPEWKPTNVLDSLRQN